MNVFFATCCLFFTGGVFGWILEVFWRHYVSHRKEHKWINPGFLKGPFLPIYGFGLSGLFLIKRGLNQLFPQTWWATIVILAIMVLGMTLIEYVGGILFIKCLGIKLWDYSKEWGNIQGVICPLYSLFWGVVAVLYYFLLDPIMANYVAFLSTKTYMLYIVGVFSGILLVDFAQSMQLSMRIRDFAKKHNIVVNYEKMKHSFVDWRKERRLKPKFIRFVTAEELKDGLTHYLEQIKNHIKK